MFHPKLMSGLGEKAVDARTLKAAISVIGLSFFFFVLKIALAQENPLFDLKQVADKSPPHVEKILGQPPKLLDEVFRGTRGSTYQAKRGFYMNGAIEVAYMEEGARYVTVWIQKLGGKYQDYSYPKDAWTLLGDLGLDLDRNVTADISNQFTTRWRNISGIYEINVFPTAGKTIWYLHVLTNRRYE